MPCAKPDTCGTPGAKLCRSCNMKRQMADPAWAARRRAGLSAAMADPDYRRRQSEGQKRALAEKMKDPDFVERLREHGRRYGAANLALGDRDAARAKAVIAIKAKHLAWCPPEFWPLNAQLKRNQIPLDERKRIIGEMIPGTPEHARLAVKNAQLAGRLKHERELRDAY